MVENGIVDTLEGVVWLLTPITEVIVIAVLTRLRLVRMFIGFSLYLTADVARSLFMWWVGRSTYSKTYSVLWLTTEPVFLFFECVLVLELYRLLYAAYPGIHGFARLLIAVAAAVAVIVTFGTFSLDAGRVVWSVPDIQRMFLTKGVVSSLLGLIVLVTMIFFPRAASAKNVLLHGWLLAGMFLVASGGFFAVDFGFETQWVGSMLLILQMTCFVGWAVGLRKPVARVEKPSLDNVEKIEKWNRDLLAVGRWLVSK